MDDGVGRFRDLRRGANGMGRLDCKTEYVRYMHGFMRSVKAAEVAIGYSIFSYMHRRFTRHEQI
jgi:hypothetical protein